MAYNNGYIGRSPSDSSVIIARQTYQPTGVQTDFTFSANYDVGYLDAYINGVRLIEGLDYTATDGSVVGLTTFAQNGDVIELIAYKAFTVADVNGNFTVGANLEVVGNISAGGSVTASAFIGDGSGLTGITASGTEIGVKDSGSTVGTATTVDFGSNLSVSPVVAGIVTVTASGESTYANVAGIATYTSEWILGANGTSDFTFTGPGFTGAENDPTLYLTRGQQYKFTNNSGGSHPFRIQSTPNGSTGTQYNDGITNNDTATGTLTWDVQFDAPDTLYYQCTNHGAMGGKIYILNAGISTDSSINTTGIITATSFVGDLTGNVTGNVTGTASTATTVTVADESSDTTCFPVFTIDATGNLAPKTDASALTYNASTGTLTATNLNSTSDINLKKDIEVITNATELLNQVRGVKFTWKGTDTKSTGVIAQEVENVLPELISERSDTGEKSVNYNGLVGVLIEAVKELSARVEELENKLEK